MTQYLIKSLTFSDLFLMDGRELLWLILVPRREVREFIELDEADQGRLIAEINQVSRVLKAHFPCDKLNIAMLGNVVPQLHAHVIARRFDDPFFPKAPFGEPLTPYTPEEAEGLMQELRTHLESQG